MHSYFLFQFYSVSNSYSVSSLEKKNHELECDKRNNKKEI